MVVSPLECTQLDNSDLDAAWFGPPQCASPPGCPNKYGMGLLFLSPSGRGGPCSQCLVFTAASTRGAAVQVLWPRHTAVGYSMAATARRAGAHAVNDDAERLLYIEIGDSRLLGVHAYYVCAAEVGLWKGAVCEVACWKARKKYEPLDADNLEVHEYSGARSTGWQNEAFADSLVPSKVVAMEVRTDCLANQIISTIAHNTYTIHNTQYIVRTAPN